MGRAGLDDLEALASSYKWSQEELSNLRDYYREKIKAIERGEDPRTASETVDMQSMFADIQPPDNLLQSVD